MDNKKHIEFFDCNVRLGISHRPEDRSFATPQNLLERMDYYDIECALAYHEEALSNPPYGNDLLISEIKKHDRIFGCAILTPSYSGEYGDIGEYFKKLVNEDIKAIRLFPNKNNFLLKDFCLEDVLTQAEIYKMPVLVDCININDKAMPYSAWSYSPDYVSIYDLAIKFPKVNFIVIMPGMTTQRTQFALMSKTPNVYFECSSFGYKNIEYICKRFSADKLVFGTYSPQLDPGPFICYIMYADISAENKLKISSTNLKQLLGVD